MKKRLTLFGLFVALAALTTHAQITQYFSQDFETGTPVNYTIAGNAAVQTNLVSGGSRALKMTHTATSGVNGGEVTITLDTIDLTSNATLNYYTLEFQHIAFVDPVKCAGRTNNCIIEVWRPGQSGFQRLPDSYYNKSDNYSSIFSDITSFNKECYNDWNVSTTPNSTMWRSERFDLENFLQGVDITQKKIVVRFKLFPRNTTTSQTEGWYLDDIKVRASSQPIVTPHIEMRAFPDQLNYPSSRGARVVCDLSTTVPQGINTDSVYLRYRISNNPTVHRAYMHRIAGAANRFEGQIPFVGYDTLVHYQVVAQDSTVNSNTVYFPKNSSQWKTFRCVRGYTNSAQPLQNTTNSVLLPFPEHADNRSEWIYDSVLLAQLGYKAGAITSFAFKVNTSPRPVTRPHLQIRMANVPNSHTRISTNENFTSSEMQIVYDSAFVVPQASHFSLINVDLQDTFHYAGSDIIVQFIYDGSTNLQGTSLCQIPVVTNKSSLYLDGWGANYQYNAFADLTASYFASGYVTNVRPWMQLNAFKNVPLINDCGICAMAYPSYETPCNTGNDSVVVWLKNFGVQPINAVRIGYSIDNAATVWYNWTGSLAAGDSVRVKVNNSQNFTVGYHTIRAWVDDTLTVGTARYRDHEPFNDTVNTPFSACSGPYSGIRTVGTGSGAHFATLEQCLYALSRCGINGNLTIKLPAGTYDVTTFPFIPGTSATRYVLFEPATANAQVVFRRASRGNNTNAPALVDMSEARSIRFNNIKFANGRSADNRCDVLVQMGRNSSNCQFLNCQFIDSNTVNNSADALLHSGGADSLTIQHCFVYGGKVGIHTQGVSADRSAKKNVIQYNDFANQVNIAVKLENQTGLLVDSNYMNDVLTNAGPFIIYGNHLYGGSRITRNRVYSSKGASCIGVSNMYGTATQYNFVANNMMVSLDDGTSNQLVTPLNIIRGEYLKVVFNSVRMKANSRVGIAAATLGGDTISNSYFQNNVVAAFDTTNYAFNYIPLHNAANLHVDHNCYYTMSGVLNKMTGILYNNLNTWRNNVPTDLGSVYGDPLFTNNLQGTRVDLRSFNELLRHKGVAVAGITNDIENRTRHASTPSLGAYEVEALSVDLTPEEFITPLEDYCGAPSNIPMKVSIRNTGTGTCTGTITVSYSIDNGQWRTNNITGRTIPSGDTAQFVLTGRTENFPCNSDLSNRTYNIKWVVRNTSDPDNLNDTAIWTVVSRYAPAAPTVINQSVQYGNTVTITPTAGINSWPVCYYNSGRQQKSGISWFHSNDPNDSSFYYGPSYTTPQMFTNDTLYISQRRNLPLVKITEVQVNRTATGATSPMPVWMNSSTAFAVELTNVGDYPADLENDSIVVVMPSGNPKVWVLPRVTIQPHENLVLQFKTLTTPSDSSHTIFAPSTAVATPAFNANFGVIYRDGKGVADAVAFNGVTSLANWTSQSVPQAAWKGSGISMGTTACAGARRMNWPASTTSISNTATQWMPASATNVMHIGETEENLILYTDNGCDGQRAAVRLNVIGRPTTDIAVDAPVVDTGCNLTNAEQVMVTVHNYGSSASGSITVNYSLNGSNTPYGTYTIAGGIPSLGQQTVTFPQTINMHAFSDTVFHVKVWVNNLGTDGPTRAANDTNSADFLSRYTPNQPIVNAPAQVDYGTTATITTTNVLQNRGTAIWYNAAHQPLDTVRTGFVTPNIYHTPDTFYVKAVGLVDVPSTHIGTLATTLSNNFPSPYNPKLQYVHEQYIYTAAQITAAGHGAGMISSLSFFLTSLGNNVTSFTFSDYTIKLGTTTQTTFANTTFLTAANAQFQQVYQRSNLTLDASNIGWVKHQFDTPFQWDGTSSIVVDICRTLSTAGISAGANTQYTAEPNTTITKSAATNTNNATLGATIGTKGNNRPDLMLGFLEAEGCESPETMITIGVGNVPAVDAALDFDPALDTMIMASCAATPLNVVITCRGLNNINAYTLRYKVDNGSWQNTTGNASNLATGYSRTVPLMSQALTPGRHTVIAVVNVSGDGVHSNDTIRRTFNVRFCTGTYTVGTNKNYSTLAVALDTLHNAGVAGPVTFALSGQTFNQQLQLGAVDGVSAANRVIFTTAADATEQATITFNPTQAANYVMNVDGASYITFDKINFYAGYTGTGTSAFANVLRLKNTDHLTFRNCTIRSKASKANNGTFTATSANANLMLLDDNNCYLTVDSCLLDSGYYAIHTLPAHQHSHYITLTDNTITNFLSRGIDLRNVDTVFVEHDSLSSGTTLVGKAMTGIYLANGHSIAVKRNFVLLMDNQTGGKRGIQLCNVKGTNIDRATVYNNMVSLKGTAVASLPTAGIWIDTTCKYMNVFFNSVRIYCGANQAASKAFNVSRSSNIHVLNNIFDNESKGYAYYVEVDTCVANSNYNAYWSNCEPNANTGARKFVHWGNVTASADRTCLDSLRSYNHQDVNSYEEEIYFRSERDLRMLLAQFTGCGQYNPDVMTDIFSFTRNQIPPPTIGCHEFRTRDNNITLAAITEPRMPSVTTGSNPEVLNIETDSILVRVQLYNNGNSVLHNVHWYAYMADVNPLNRSVERVVRNVPLRTMVEDSVRLNSPLGVVDTQYIVVVVTLDPSDDLEDADTTDNRDTVAMFIYPAYDLKVVSVSITDNTPVGCRLYNIPINYVIKNEGKKDFPADYHFCLGYDFYLPNTPAGFNAPNYPGMAMDCDACFGTVLPVGTDLPITISQPYWANLYPTGYLGDLMNVSGQGNYIVKLRGWVSYVNDVKPLNDTSNYINVNAKHTPPSPIGHDTIIDYGSYGVLTAIDSDGVALNKHNPIRWCRDTTSGSCFWEGTGNNRTAKYNSSKRWVNSPQFFHDSTYYLCCISDQGCTSYYSEIHVTVNPPLQNDVSISEVLSPRTSGRVYSEVDTVRLRVVNYGAAPATNIPITYEFYSWANNRTTLRQTRTDTIRATIPGRMGDSISHYDFVFSSVDHSTGVDTSLLYLKTLNPNVATTAITYKLNAWVNMSGDQQTNNDTLHALHSFTTLPESTYDYARDSLAPTGTAGFDITHVSFNELNTYMPDMIGYNYVKLGAYNPAQAEIPTLRVRRGTTDTLTIEVANNQDEMDTRTGASVLVAIDYNRDGYYDLQGSENITKVGMDMGVKVHSRQPYQMVYTVPQDCHYGYMRMMVWAVGDSNAYATGFPEKTDNGQMQEYLLFIVEPGSNDEDSIDGALTRIVAPSGPIVTDTVHFVSVMLANKGKTPLNNATINYSFNNPFRSLVNGRVSWNGNLMPGESEVVMLDSINFLEGTTNLTLNLNIDGDTNHVDNNVLEYRFHRYYKLTLRFIDSFNEDIDKWYVPAGYNNFTRNYWVRSAPSKQTISTDASPENGTGNRFAYVTDDRFAIQSGIHGNRSVLYLPIINIAQIHPDSISFMLSKNMTGDSRMWAEYFSYENKWVKMDDPGARYDQEMTGWYDNADGWSGSTPAGSYEFHGLSTSSTGLSGEFPQNLRIRFVYTTPQAAAGTSFGEGCAIDNFRIGRAPRPIDVGVTEITYPTDPRFGQTIHPKVKIKNFGTGPMVNFTVAYRVWGTFLPMEEIVRDSIYPGEEIEFEFSDPFTVTNDFPLTFPICAFTKVSSDYYDDNDTTCHEFSLSPLADDMYMDGIIEPLDRAVAGDSINITLRILNFGQAEVPECNVVYRYNGGTPVVEHINFSDYLGHPLPSREYFNYTFRHRERATMGTMELNAWVDYSADAYRYNDTTSKQIAGVSAITDIQATEVTVNDQYNRVQMNLVLDNVGARMVNDFKVGFYYDNDTNTRFEETFHRDGGIAAGGRAVHAFSRILDGRPYGWEYVTAYCVVPDDYNTANDTSVDNIKEKRSDIAALKVEVEENRNDSCRVRIQLVNMGNTTHDPIVAGAPYNLSVTINGKNIRTQGNVPLEPGVSRYINFEKKIVKNPDRKYTGKGEVLITDSEPANNSTTRVEVVNYFEGVPLVQDEDFVLEQNFPNPFEGVTRIEFNLPTAGTARFVVTDVVGRMVREQTLKCEAGRQTIAFDRSDLPAGVYYYTMEFNGETRMHKMIVR